MSASIHRHDDRACAHAGPTTEHVHQHARRGVRQVVMGSRRVVNRIAGGPALEDAQLDACRHSRESEEVWTRVVTSVRSLGSSGFLINKKMMGCGRLCETALRAVWQARVGASCASTGAAASIAPAVVSPRAFG